ncbi:diadenosine tetraphosphatase [compost metagenome]
MRWFKTISFLFIILWVMNMKNKIFAIGDIHGQLHTLDVLLTQWNPDSQLLVFLGDYIDRGSNSYGVIRRVKELHDNYGAIVLSGNHETNFLNWLDAPEDYWFSKWVEDESVVNFYEDAQDSSSIWYYSNGGDKTVGSFYGGSKAYVYLPSRHSEYIKNNYGEYVGFLRNLPNYFEYNNYVFVHAGVNLLLSDWKNSSQDDFRRIRGPFHNSKNETGKTFVFGHHTTKMLNQDKSNNVWVSKCNTKIGIDGGAVFGGLLHGLVIDGDNKCVYSVDKNNNVSNTIV